LAFDLEVVSFFMANLLNLPSHYSLFDRLVLKICMVRMNLF